MQNKKIILPNHVLRETIRYLKEFGATNSEGYCCWAGIIDDDKIIVKSLITPASIETSFAYARINSKSATLMAQKILEKKEILLAQIHTHPYEAFHSRTDDLNPISHRKGFISMVVPNFGKDSYEDLLSFAIFEYLGKGKWTEIDNTEKDLRFAIIDSNLPKENIWKKLWKWITKRYE